MAVEWGLSKENCRTDFSACKISLHQPSTINAQWGLLQAAHTQCPESQVPPKGVEAFIAALKVGLTTKEHLLMSSVPNTNPGSEIFAFSFSVGWTPRLITSLPVLPKDCVLQITLLVTMVKCVVPFLMNKDFPKYLLMWLPMSKNLFFDFLSSLLSALMNTKDASNFSRIEKTSNITDRAMRYKTAVSARRSAHTMHSHIPG